MDALTGTAIVILSLLSAFQMWLIMSLMEDAMYMSDRIRIIEDTLSEAEEGNPNK